MKHFIYDSPRLSLFPFFQKSRNREYAGWFFRPHITFHSGNIPQCGLNYFSHIFHLLDDFWSYPYDAKLFDTWSTLVEWNIFFHCHHIKYFIFLVLRLWQTLWNGHSRIQTKRTLGAGSWYQNKVKSLCTLRGKIIKKCLKCPALARTYAPTRWMIDCWTISNTSTRCRMVFQDTLMKRLCTINVQFVLGGPTDRNPNDSVWGNVQATATALPYISIFY